MAACPRSPTSWRKYLSPPAAGRKSSRTCPSPSPCSTPRRSKPPAASTSRKLTQLQPSLQFYSTNPRNSAVNIRGLGAPFGLTNDGIEQGVGIYVDEVYYSRIAAATFDFLDVERLEVLRGPQGTLYGKNTTAGAINITTRAPSFTPEARAEITIGNLGLVQAKAAFSGPLIDDTLAGRLAVSATSRHGTIYNTRSQNNGQRTGQHRHPRPVAVARQRRPGCHLRGRLQPPGSRVLRADLRRVTAPRSVRSTASTPRCPRRRTTWCPARTPSIA